MNKGTVARIYLQLNGWGSRYEGAPVRLYFRVNGVWHDVDATGTALNALDRATEDSVDIWFKVNATQDTTVDVYAVVDPEHLIPETDESNNRYPATGYISVTFRQQKTLKVVGQRVRYHPPGYTGEEYADGWAVDGGAARYLERILPVPNGSIVYTLRSGYLDWTSSLATSTGQHQLIQRLNDMWLLDQVIGRAFVGAFPDADHVYGWVPGEGLASSHPDMPTYPHAGGWGVVAIGPDTPGSTVDVPGKGAYSFAKALLHNHDLKNPNTVDACGAADASSDWPYSSASIGEFGFNPDTGVIYDPGDTHDVLSNCPAGGSKRGWVSPHTWERMSNVLGANLTHAATVGTAGTALEPFPALLLETPAPLAHPPLGAAQNLCHFRNRAPASEQMDGLFPVGL